MIEELYIGDRILLGKGTAKIVKKYRNNSNETLFDIMTKNGVYIEGVKQCYIKLCKDKGLKDY